MVESIVCVGWVWRNVDDVGGSSTGSEGIGKHLKRRKVEGVITGEQSILERTRNIPR